uniref:Uncharacterized protein n=1 Tax=Mycena chlorophos TaxID=658473 RepID=A0ABQ0M8F1_MYCCL|nr:predicted protein [Mycena chlorophos]
MPFTEDELVDAGLVGDGLTQNTLSLMETHPQLSIFALRCLEHQRRYYSSERTASPRISPSNNPESPADYVLDDDYPVPFPKPSGRFSAIPVKSVWGVHDTSLNRIWLDVTPRMYNLLRERNLRSFSIDPARFFTHEEGNRKNGTLGPPVVWIGCKPESTTAATAHTISLEILALLRANDAPDVVVEWRESAFQQLAADTSCPTVPDDSAWRFRGICAFDLGVHEHMTEDEDVTKEDKEKVVGRNRRALEDALEAARDLECFYHKIVGWSDFKFRILGDLEYASAITIDAATQHTIDWAAFKVHSAAVKRNFAGNIIDLVMPSPTPDPFAYNSGAKQQHLTLHSFGDRPEADFGRAQHLS